MGSGEASLFLTQKGTEELRSRAHKLDFAARNILFLIERGSTSANAILRRSIYPRDKVMDKLSRLMSNEFVAVAPGDGGRLPRASGDLSPPAWESPPTRGEAPSTPLKARSTADTRDSAASPAPEPMSLEDGISLAQARFALSDFCLDHLGEPGPELAIAIKRCSDLPGLQNLLDRMCLAVLDHCRDRLPKLRACVREINQTNV